jgi:hypothetical protein
MTLNMLEVAKRVCLLLVTGTLPHLPQVHKHLQAHPAASMEEITMSVLPPVDHHRHYVYVRLRFIKKSARGNNDAVTSHELIPRDTAQRFLELFAPTRQTDWVSFPEKSELGRLLGPNHLVSWQQLVADYVDGADDPHGVMEAAGVIQDYELPSLGLIRDVLAHLM